MSSPSTPTSPSSRMEVVQAERDIQLIKATLRQVTDENKPNSLEVVWTQLEGVEASEDLEVSLQLSSPVEEGSITKMRAEGEEAVEGSSMTFSGVESSMATLTVTLKKDGKILGTSEAHDMAPVCRVADGLKPKGEYILLLHVPIEPAPGEEAAFIKPAEEEKSKEEKEEKPKVEEAAADADKKEETSGDSEEKEGATEESKEDDDEKEEPKEEEEKKPESDTKEESSSTAVKPTVSLQMIFKPSAKDQKEELYELLNKASLRRSQALERHRGEQQTAVAKKSPNKKPAVKAGFLNKKKEPEAEEPNWKQLYHKYLGPQSLARIVFPIAKNYVIFFGFVVLGHFKAQELALPAPV